MKATRILLAAIAATLTMTMSAQQKLTEEAKKAQTSLINHLRVNGFTPTIERDGSVKFQAKDGSQYYVTVSQGTPVLYTMRSQGIGFGKVEGFKPEPAIIACNKVNNKYRVKALLDEGQNVRFTTTAYANDPATFNDNVFLLVADFNGVRDEFNKLYQNAVKDFDEKYVVAPVVIPTPGKSPLEVSKISFANFATNGSKISDFDQPLRKSEVQCIKAKVDYKSAEKGVFKLCIRVTNTEGKIISASAGVDYTQSANVEVKKAGKVFNVEMAPFGTSDASFWKPGEYKVEIFDFEKPGHILLTSSFNIL